MISSSLMKESIEQKEKVSAGGIVLDDEGRVLMVHRPRYDDWSFPKGGVDSGETIEQAALREVLEEAGLQCKIIRQLSDSRYLYTTPKGATRAKVVHYFLMEITGGRLFADGLETDEAAWCSLEEAEKRLSYAGDKAVLQELV
jgi:8-oxo-dGTP pyrophosphatase MutT (NUDIX family)